MTKNTIAVELFFEDLFFPKIEEECPISEENWQIWAEKWFNLLKSSIYSHDSYELSLRLTDDLEIKNLNSQFRHKNQPTDVLSFAALEVETPFNTPQESEPLYLGDIIISVETAGRQAQQQKHSLAIELAWLMSHGFLHLLGWDHPNQVSLTKMLNQQKILLDQVGITTKFKI